VSQSSLSIYSRSEGYFLVTSAQTTAGLWQHVDEPPTFLGAPTPSAQIGREAVKLLAEPRPTTAHPQRDEWTETSRQSLERIIRAAKVRSWRTFISKTALVEVERTNETFTVTPMKALSNPHGAFEPDPTKETELASPSPEDLGRAILQAFRVATPA
jgi:hypothetical protein